MVSFFTKVKRALGVEPEEFSPPAVMLDKIEVPAEKQLVEAFTEVEKEFEEVKEEFEQIKEEVTKEEEPEMKEREPFPIEVGDILYKCDIVGGEPLIDWKCMEIKVTSINEEEDTFIAEPKHKERHPYLYRDEYYVFSVKDMIRQPFLEYKEIYPKEKALTYREKLTVENNFWRGKPKAGDIFYGKRFIESDNTYSSITGKFKVLGVTQEAFSAAPIDKDNNLDENETLIFDINTLLEIALRDTHPVQLFTTQDNAHTAYLHKQIEKKNRESK
ncbi:hypothetical protein CHOTACABRAS_10 [Bacillus phage Chotacabras]|nr:hypothetical protein CHOTACABRAS_10 [Bacillus phage Chotacabras]